jgi:hypothetical protein
MCVCASVSAVCLVCLVCLGESGGGATHVFFRSAFQVLGRRRQQHYLDISVGASGRVRRNRRIDPFRLRYGGLLRASFVRLCLVL